MGKLWILVALLVAVALVQANVPAEVTADDIVTDIDDDLDLLNLGLPEFADLEEATNQVESYQVDDDEDDDIDIVDDDDDDEDDDEADDVETIRRNQRGKWQRMRQNERRNRSRVGRKGNATEEEEPRGPRNRGRRPWRNQQSIGVDGEEERGGHHHRHRKGGGRGHGRGGRHRHGNGRHRRPHRFRFNATEANRWQAATWQQKVNHVCGKLTRHQARLQRAQTEQATNQNARRTGTFRRRRLEFLGRMGKCCGQEERDSCFYHLRHQVCANRTAQQPWRQDLPEPVKNAFSRIRCCQNNGWRRHMCFSRYNSTLPDFLKNQTFTTEAPTPAPELEEVAQPMNMDVMLGDMPVVEVSNFDGTVDAADNDDDFLDDDDDIDDDDVTDEDEEPEVRRRPHHGREGRRDRHQGRRKGRKQRVMWRRCCKAGHKEGLDVETEAEAVSACGTGAATYMQRVPLKQICKRAYKQCCIKAATQ